MFISFFYLLRARGLNVSLNEWLALIEALDKGLCKASLLDFYHLCRSILVKSETDYDNSTWPSRNILRESLHPTISRPKYGNG